VLDLARQLRRDMTLPERMLWNAIRGRQLGPRFRRQVPMDPYVVDLYCAEAKLIVEVDGEHHDDRWERDAERTAVLERRGYRVVRFTATQVLTDITTVLEALSLVIQSPPPASGLLPREGGGA